MSDAVGGEPAPVGERLGAGPAGFVGWLGLAVVNQVLLLAQAVPGAFELRLTHHAYDAGQLLAAGCLSWGISEFATRAGARLGAAPSSRWPRALALGLACFAVTLLVVAPDVSNAAARYRVPVWAASLAAALSFGVLLGATAFLTRIRVLAVRGLYLLFGIAGAAGNAFVLLGDYPAAHLIIAWLSAALIAAAVESILPRPKLPRTFARAALATALALSFTAVLGDRDRAAVFRATRGRTRSRVSQQKRQFRGGRRRHGGG